MTDQAKPPKLSWEEWGQRLEHARALQRRDKNAAHLATMHARHGPGPKDRTCGGCMHYVKLNQDTARGGYPKCGLFSDSRCGSSDWRASWAACGAYQAKPGPPWTEKRSMGDKWWRYYRDDELLGAIRYRSRYGLRLPTGAGGFDVGWIDYTRVWLVKVPDRAEPSVFGSLKQAEEALAEHVRAVGSVNPA